MTSEVALPVLRRMKAALGTFVEVGVFEADPRAPAAAVRQAVAAAFARIMVIERLMSFHDPASELSRLNRARGAFVELSSPTLRALRLARAMTRASGGVFNCTVGGALVSRGALPDHGCDAALPMGTADDIEIRGNGARLARPVLVTLDGIAKGFAVDEAIATLRRHGVRHAWVNAGGDVRVSGDHALPVRLRGCDVTISLAHGALATSASRAVFDRATPGLIVARDGASASGQWTVVARRAWRADALTKVAALLSEPARTATIEQLSGRVLHAASPRSTLCAA